MVRVVKRLVFILILIPSICHAEGAYKFYFFGFEPSFIKTENIPMLIVGGVSTVLLHEQGHEIFDGGTWERRGGYFLQSVVGLGLTSFEKTRDWSFTKGFVGTTAFELATYKARGGVDFDNITKYGGDGDVEFFVYSVVALHNFLRLDWKEKGNGDLRAGKASETD